MKDPKDHGYWDGDVYHFTPPLEFAGKDDLPHTVRSIDLTQLALGEGISRDDVVHAMLNPVHHNIEGEPDA